MESSAWAFVYRGTITDADALRAALDPTWTVNAALATVGDLVFVHLLTHLASVGPRTSSDLAMIRAAQGLGLARALGALAFVCSDGRRLYAYGLGTQLALSRVTGAVVVGSPDLVPESATIETVISGELVSLWREPLSKWSVLVTPDR
jgi:hypothetical protein